MRQNHVGRWLVVLGGVAGLGLAGCSSAGHGPFPTDPEPCATYCPKWVEPVYRPVPRLVETRPSCMQTVKVPMQRVEFAEVVKPAEYTPKCVPDECRKYAAVEVEPAHDEWVKVACADPCGCTSKECWKQIRVPAKYKWCEKTETEKGFKYCAFTPPEYEIVPHTVTSCQPVQRYVPAQYGVMWDKELFQPGHWSWEKRYDCGEAKRPCPPTGSCAPIYGGPSGSGSIAPREDFSRCPCAD